MASRFHEEIELKSYALSQKAANAPKQKTSKKSNLVLQTLPTTSRDGGGPSHFQQKKKFIDNFYDSDTKSYCGRTCSSWAYIIGYSMMYVIFLSTFTMLILYPSLCLLKLMTDFKGIEKVEMLTYPSHGIGLSAAPTSVSNYPLIWYKNGKKDDYFKYVQALDKLLSSDRRKREVSHLGPCGYSPYGYGEKPCVIVRINKQFKWSGQPMLHNSTNVKSAPAEVLKWMKTDKSKLWLECNGYHSYDKEHIGRISYYPDPPGFDPAYFPLDSKKSSPLVAIQISDFSIGISLAVRCNLWYDAGPSTIDFVLYVAPEDRIANSTKNSVNV